MIAAWMVYGALVAVVVGAAAFAIEYALRALRRPVRYLWIGALIVTVFLPGIQFLVASTAAPSVLSAPSSSIGVASAPGAASPRAQRDITPIAAQPPLRFPRAVAVPNALSTLDSPLLGLWFTASILWAAILLVSAARLHRQRGAWRAATIDGMPVYVSHDVGPALFGIARYSIVVPGWVLSLDDNRRQLILAHEREHARAADPVVLATGALLVMLQPWNPGVWLMFRRLRFGIELDCDARVLARTPDVRSYGELLLEVGDRTLAGAVPLAALSEPHSLLERRISIMTSIPPSRPLLRGLVSLTGGALLAIGACSIPRPTPAEITGQTAVTDATPPAGSDRVIVRITEVGLTTTVRESPTVLIFASNSARVGIGNDAPTILTDTLRLSTLPAMTLDVTDGDVHVLLVSPGQIMIRGTVTGGPATHFSAMGRHIVVRKGGTGIWPRS